MRIRAAILLSLSISCQREPDDVDTGDVLDSTVVSDERPIYWVYCSLFPANIVMIAGTELPQIRIDASLIYENSAIARLPPVVQIAVLPREQVPDDPLVWSADDTLPWVEVAPDDSNLRYVSGLVMANAGEFAIISRGYPREVPSWMEPPRWTICGAVIEGGRQHAVHVTVLPKGSELPDTDPPEDTADDSADTAD